MADAELLALLLDTGSTASPALGEAASVLDACGGLAGLGRSGLGELEEALGSKLGRASRILAAIELGRRVHAAQGKLLAHALGSSAAVHAWAEPHLAMLEHEELWLLALDGRNRLRAARRVAMGGLHGVGVSARDPLRLAIREAASAFVLVHNHPSGDPTPSEMDLAFTKEVLRAANIVGTPLVDHVIVSSEGYVSMLDRGVLEFLDAPREPSAPPP